MALFVARNLINIRSRIKINPCLIRLYNQHPNCNEIIGGREWVGYGRNSEPQYLDHPGFPFPAIRFKEDSADLLALREKEKGDWRNLSIDDKKTLYRASFCQTYSEFMADTGVWKSIIGCSLMLVSLGIWVFLFFRWCYSTELPDSYSPSRQKAQLQRLIDLEMNPIHGLASKWDYKKKKWK